VSPLPLRIEVIDGTVVSITWEDEVSTEIAAADLRAACMCAVCREPAGAKATEAVLSGPSPVTIAEAALVGGYAISFVFGPDGHGTGIYPYTALRKMGSTGETVG
jgi:ATP-binding protein involved in chromosome partitioning